jgi:hypothetical protein
MNDCQHDLLYRIENEAAGGIGCPICNRRRMTARAQRAAMGLQTEDDRIEAQRQRNAEAAPVPGWFQHPQVTLDEIAEMEARCAEQQIDRDTNAGMCN